jgi:hypothetical protein
MTTRVPTVPPLLSARGVARTGRRAVGCLFLWTGGVHVGILSADPGAYRHFADDALFGFVRRGWADVFMAHPRLWALALAATQMTVGILLLTRGRAIAVGWAGVLLFDCLLLLFGFSYWLSAVPALVLASLLAWADAFEWRPLRSRRRRDAPAGPTSSGRPPTFVRAPGSPARPHLAGGGPRA